MRFSDQDLANVGGDSRRSVAVDGILNALLQIAQRANDLAKELTGPSRAAAYRIKAQACSALILEGAARVNGVRPGGILALDLHGNPPSRLHVRCSHLIPAARRVVDEQAATVPVVAPLGEWHEETTLDAIVPKTSAPRRIQSNTS